MMVNTYGFGSMCVSEKAFPLSPEASQTKQTVRKFFITALRIHNAILHVLGYLPWSAPISGCVRVAAGAAMGIASLFVATAFKEGKAGKELLITGLWQMARGTLEAFYYIPAVIINGACDIITTIPEPTEKPAHS